MRAGADHGPHNWKYGQTDINVLLLGVTYKNVAFPLLFRLLPKRGKLPLKFLEAFRLWTHEDQVASLLEAHYIRASYCGNLNRPKTCFEW